jgi:hypothetical protein
MLLIIQEIKVKWTKLSRGAPHAARRNAVPSILPLPPSLNTASPPTADRSIVHHQITFDEANDFTPHATLTLKTIDPPNRHFKFGCLHPQWTSESAQIIFTYSASCGGAPDRSAPPQTVLTLHPDQWGQIIYNGRFSRGYSGDWYYQHFVFNIALLPTTTAALDPALFTTTPPIKVYKNLVQLR